MRGAATAMVFGGLLIGGADLTWSQTKKAAAAVEQLTPEVEKSWLPVDLLPPGTVLKGVRLPRYREGRFLGEVVADRLTIVSDRQVSGDEVNVVLKGEQGFTTKADLAEADYNLESGLLKARGGVSLVDERFEAQGEELDLDMNRQQGFLVGPVRTKYFRDEEIKPLTTTMKKGSGMMAATCLAAMTPCMAETPPQLSEAERREMESLLAPAEPKGRLTEAELVSAMALHGELAQMKNAARTAAEDVEEARRKQSEVREATNEFLSRVGRDSLLIQAPAVAPAGDAANPHEPLKPPALEKGKPVIDVQCEDGMFFDADKGVFVYLKNVRLRDPQLSLDCDDQLKVFMGKKPVKPGEEEKSGVSAFGAIDRIAAGGSVVVEVKNTKGERIVAKAESLTYKVEGKGGVIILSGGNQTISDGKNLLSVSGPGSYIRINKDGSFYAKGQRNETKIQRPEDGVKP